VIDNRFTVLFSLIR